MVTVMVGKPTDSGICRVETLTESADDPKYTEFPANKSELAPGKPKWCNYVKGVAAQMPGISHLHNVYTIFPSLNHIDCMIRNEVKLNDVPSIFHL